VQGSLEEYGSRSAKFECVGRREPGPALNSANEFREWAQMTFQIPYDIKSAICINVEEKDKDVDAAKWY
jgi:hypothetical protein